VMGPAVLASIAPATPNWFACSEPMAAPYGLDFRLATSARRHDVVPCFGALPAAIHSLGVIARAGIGHIHAHNIRLANLFCQRMDLPPVDSAILAFTEPGGLERLAAAGVRATGYADRVRLAFHLYNDEQDVDLAVHALRA
jgi:selenocysteine lyase/cysteine desulfurase